MLLLPLQHLLLRLMLVMHLLLRLMLGQVHHRGLQLRSRAGVRMCWVSSGLHTWLVLLGLLVLLPAPGVPSRD